MIRFFILAGGYGKRAKPLSDYLPKPLFPLGGKPLINILLDQLAGKKITDGFVNIHYLHEGIRDSISTYDAEIVYERELSGSSILKTASGRSDDLVLTVNGDTYMDIPVNKMLKKLEETGSDGILLITKSDPDYANLVLSDDKFISVSGAEPSPGYSYSGAALFRANLLREFNEMNFFETLNRVEPDIRVVKYNGLWLDIGTPENYYRSEFIFRKFFGLETENSVGDSVEIHSEAKISRSIVWKKSRIREPCRIVNSILTENVLLNAGEYSKKIVTPDGEYDLNI